MSVNQYTTVECDKCQTESKAVEAGPRAARSDAKKAGWKLGKQRDLCPSCDAEIQKAIKAIQEA